MQADACIKTGTDIKTDTGNELLSGLVVPGGWLSPSCSALGSLQIRITQKDDVAMVAGFVRGRVPTSTHSSVEHGQPGTSNFTCLHLCR